MWRLYVNVRKNKYNVYSVVEQGRLVGGGQGLGFMNKWPMDYYETKI